MLKSTFEVKRKLLTSQKTLLLFYLVFLQISCLSAQDMPRVRATIDTLCTPYMGGRGYGRDAADKGERKAAEYLAAKFKKIGLQHFGQDYFQYFKLNVNTHKVVKLKINNKKLVLGQDFILNPVSKSGKGNYKVQLLDSNIFVEEEMQKRFLNENISKKVILLNKKDQKKLVDLPIEIVQKIYTAKAILELQDVKLTATVGTKENSNPIFEVKTSVIPKKLKKAKFVVKADFLKDYQTQNIIGYVRGRVMPDSFLVFSAHYDHLGKMGNIYFPGANDNASGVSMLLELAEFYAKNPPNYSVAFMFFGAEEAGLVGSQYYTENPLFDLKKIKFLTNLDLVGTGDEGATVVNATLFPEEFSILQELDIKGNYLPKITKRGKAANSDHYFFSQKGVKAFFIYTLGGIKAYHDVDDIAKTLPLTRYTQFFALMKDFIKALDKK